MNSPKKHHKSIFPPLSAPKTASPYLKQLQFHVLSMETKSVKETIIKLEVLTKLREWYLYIEENKKDLTNLPLLRKEKKELINELKLNEIRQFLPQYENKDERMM
ncbi:hypothetical protein QTN25_003405 [Entamoeba marina]